MHKLFIRHAQADDICVHLECKYFLDARWPPLFFGRSPFLFFFHYTKKKSVCGNINYFSYTIQIGSNWCMNTAVHDFYWFIDLLIFIDLFISFYLSFFLNFFFIYLLQFLAYMYKQTNKQTNKQHTVYKCKKKKKRKRKISKPWGFHTWQIT